jgi:hypothetical protein
VRDLDRQRAGVDQLVPSSPASGQPVTLRTTSPQAPLGLRPISVSASTISTSASMVSQCSWIFCRVVMSARLRACFLVIADDAELVRGEQAVGQADAHHEVLGGLAFAALAAGDASAVALGVDAPPLEVELGPLGQHGVAAFARELAHLVPRLPGVLGELQALGLLGLGFLWRCRGRWCGCEVAGFLESLLLAMPTKRLN